jgi:hypothetical protein
VINNQKVTQAVVVSQAIMSPSQGVEQLALFNVDGSVLSVAPDTGATVLLTGYTTTTGVHALAAGDSVNAAMAKIESRLAILEA